MEKTWKNNELYQELLAFEKLLHERINIKNTSMGEFEGKKNANACSTSSWW